MLFYKTLLTNEFGRLSRTALLLPTSTNNTVKKGYARVKYVRKRRATVKGYTLCSLFHTGDWPLMSSTYFDRTEGWRSGSLAPTRASSNVMNFNSCCADKQIQELNIYTYCTQLHMKVQPYHKYITYPRFRLLPVASRMGQEWPIQWPGLGSTLLVPDVCCKQDVHASKQRHAADWKQLMGRIICSSHCLQSYVALYHPHSRRLGESCNQCILHKTVTRCPSMGVLNEAATGRVHLSMMLLVGGIHCYPAMRRCTKSDA